MKNWDIFCRVVDNYGDIGVCWRLARQLATEHAIHVRLWIDDMCAFQHIWPEISLSEKQIVQQVEVCHWKDTFDAHITPADTVIEAFACELPSVYLESMIQRKRAGNPPYWFNLEYLSAEPWVEDCHGLISMHPSSGMKKVFFFPGFTAKTGGLICEKELINRRDAFQQNSAKSQQFFNQLGIETPENSLVISLFGYENNAIGSLLNAWKNSARQVVCLVPEGKIISSINTHLGLDLQQQKCIKQGNLKLCVIPFLNQHDYDHLLWACDINFVRGEDSFIRAQWAAKPFIWNIYPQDEDAHLIKLQAFLEKYTANMETALAKDTQALWLAWNKEENSEEFWLKCLENHQKWTEHSKLWAKNLNSLGDLASNMVQFCQKTL